MNIVLECNLNQLCHKVGISSLPIPVHVVGFACALKTPGGFTVFWHWGTSRIKSHDNPIFYVQYLIAAGALCDREYGKAHGLTHMHQISWLPWKYFFYLHHMAAQNTLNSLFLVPGLAKALIQQQISTWNHQALTKWHSHNSAWYQVMAL